MMENDEPCENEAHRGSTDRRSAPRAAGEAPGSLWRHVGHRWFLVMVVAATLASQIQGAAVSYQLYALTHDPLSLGLVGLAEALPFIGLALPAGHFADVHDRKRLGAGALALLGAAAAGFWLVSRSGDHLGVGGVRACAYGLLALTGVCRAFLLPARNGLTSTIV
ncbi:MAG TPA: MFS transporter, partial [Polyangia bacterium]